MSQSPPPPIPHTNQETKTPILLLKSPSPTPTTDPYTTHLTTPPSYTPHFIPVLTHTLLPDPLINLFLSHLQQSHSTPFPYGALIFTSQRAVAAFSTALHAPPMQTRLPALSALTLDIYTVGPATASTLLPIRDRFLPRCTLHGGASAGSGEILARIILGRQGRDGGAYATRVPDNNRKKPIVFLTGEKRRDIIPKMLMDPVLSEEERIQVDEMVVYQTSELEEFEFSFARILRQTETGSVRWVVVFSPTAGMGMLRALGWLGGSGDGSGKVDRRVVEDRGRRTFVACIGPTTREYLELDFGFKADVVAEKPSPQGVRDGIERFIRERDIRASPSNTIS